MRVAEKEAMKTAGADIPATDELRDLYDEALARYGVECMWSYKKLENPTIGTLVLVAGRLRREGDLNASIFAEKIEDACHDALSDSI